jgi:hypothetical protein
MQMFSVRFVKLAATMFGILSALGGAAQGYVALATPNTQLIVDTGMDHPAQPPLHTWEISSQVSDESVREIVGAVRSDVYRFINDQLRFSSYRWVSIRNEGSKTATSVRLQSNEIDRYVVIKDRQRISDGFSKEAFDLPSLNPGESMYAFLWTKTENGLKNIRVSHSEGEADVTYNLMLSSWLEPFDRPAPHLMALAVAVILLAVIIGMLIGSSFVEEPNQK